MQREPHAGESAPNRFDPGRWSEALSAAGVAVLVLDAGLRLVGVTPGRGSAWGLGPEDVGHALSPERHGTLRAWLEGAVGSLLGDGVAVEREVRDPAGGRVLARAAAIDGSGHVAVVLLDLDRRSRREEEAPRRSREELERLVAERTEELQHQTARLRKLAGQLASAEQRERKRLAAVLHDELQQFLAAAKMRLDLASGQGPAPAVAEAIEAAGELLGRAMESSRDLTRQLRPPVLYEGGLVAALRWLASEMSKMHRLEVSIEAGAEEPEINDDTRALLFESVRELLFNIVKHASVDRARVSIRVEGDRIALAVEDEGVGFDTNILTSKAQPKGQGLFSIRERLAAIGGELRIESIPGDGTRARLLIPLAAADGRGRSGGAEAAERAGPAGLVGVPAGPRDGRVRVLVVDDHTIVREGIANTLSIDDRLVVVGEAADGVEAIEAVERYHPDVVLIDVNMPRRNGVEATREIARRWPGVRVVALSVHDDAATMDTMRRAGASGFICKTEDGAEMICKILGERAAPGG